MAIYLGVDGGGSKTALALIEDTGRVIARATAPTSYYFNDGFDIVDVTLREDDLERIPESRVHTALEASLNCEVRIHTV